MSILNNLTSILEPIRFPGSGPSENCKSEPPCEKEHDKECKPTKTDECDKETKWNNDHKGEYDKDHSNRDGDWKYAKHEDHKDDCNGQKEHSNHDGEWKYAKGEDCQTQKDDCNVKEAKYDSCEQHKDPCPPKDSCDTDCKSTVHYNENPGEVLAKLDFSSHGDLGSYDHSSEMHGALASMSSGHALDYAIGQMGPTEHFDPGHFDLPVDAHASHDVHVA